MRTFNLLILLFLIATSCKKEELNITTSSCTLQEVINDSHPKKIALQQIMDKYTEAGLPGIAIAIHSPDGYWAGASGYSKIENLSPMEPCHLQYSQSVSKTYMGVAILKLLDSGKIDLEDKIGKYLPSYILSNISDHEKITVRMLLNHTSGIPEYNDDPKYVSYLLQHPLHTFTTLDYLSYIKGKPLQFDPGSKYRYANTNYELLALIGDQITGNHAKYIRDEILVPAGITNTYYHDDLNYLDKPHLVNSYWDRYSNGAIENCSEMQKINVASMIGDDGMIATPLDYVKFLKALFDGQLLSPSSKNQMLTFVNNDPFDPEGYGLGIHKKIYKGKIEYGHSGGGIGSGCYLSYFPDTQTFFFIAINIGTAIPSPIHDRAENLQNEVFDVVLNQ